MPQSADIVVWGGGVKGDLCPHRVYQARELCGVGWCQQAPFEALPVERLCVWIMGVDGGDQAHVGAVRGEEGGVEGGDVW